MAQSRNAPLAQALVALPNAVNAAPVEAGQAILSEIHECHVPEHAAAALDRLYGSMFASWRHLQLCGAGQPAPHTWIGYRRGEIVGVLLFRMQGRAALVLTEMIALDAEIADAFSHAVFSRFAHARHLAFNAVALPRSLQPLHVQSFAFSENYVIDLPPTVDDYLAALGRSTRKTIRGYGNRLLRELPDFRWEVKPASELRRHEQRQLIRQLQRFKQASMAARGKRAVIDRRDTVRLLQLASERGLFGIASAGGRVLGGSLACRFGDNYVMLLSAADPALESLRLGLLCCFWSVCDCLRAGARQCHLLWGRYQYKSQLLGRLEPLHRVHVYRSRLQMVLSPTAVGRMVLQKLRHGVRNRLLQAVREPENQRARWFAWGIDVLRIAAQRWRHWRAHLY